MCHLPKMITILGIITQNNHKNKKALESHPEIAVHDVSPTQYQKPIDFYVKL